MLHFFIVAQKKPIIITKKKNGRKVKSKKTSVYLNFQCFRYHLCGKLKFDEFPPGVTQVKIFLFLFFLFFVVFFLVGGGGGGIVSM